ncbi:ribonuclease Oy-like isoform X1 [Mya arenaria]|uniref:ribonuclease Oy-like isoform X1 n=1 Tax=Mya arenaria TaxID=6604 RepID=UPI0022DFB14B|nr:ribonuclease Oy-like isoform X1 [Mya arenaria]XP_052816509.1 ribonuclease Oy-like isoform X1 [Mya arenaria]XP_052816510.1 ribonuclease Oy-like isoform X1 [Mya arenaria]
MARETFIVIMTVLFACCCCCRGWSKSTTYDHFTFSQSWPPGVCADGNRLHHTCHVDKLVNSWTIHGLWPTDGTSHGPCKCNSSMKFDFSKIASIKEQLMQYWPNLYNDTKLESFWEHEWDKHGTCAQDLPALKGEHNYFQKALELNQKYNIYEILSGSDIVPSSTIKYSYKNFTDAVKSSTGFTPVLVCSYIKWKNGSSMHLIDQVEICLSKVDFSPIECPSSGPVKTKGDNDWTKTGDAALEIESVAQSNCPYKYSFNYPPIQHFLDLKKDLNV